MNKPQLVKWPTGGQWEDTGEGGLAVFFVLLALDFRVGRRQACLAGEVSWHTQDVVLSPSVFVSLNHTMSNAELRRQCRDGHSHEAADLIMLVGSTEKALWNIKEEAYFKCYLSNLTPEGQELFNKLAEIYGDAPVIVTLLDT